MKHKGRKTGSRLLASLLTAAMLITAPDISILAEPAAATETTETTVTAETALAETEVAEDPVMAAEMETEMVLVYKCGQEKLNNLYYQMKEQRRCSTWRKTKNPTLRNLSSRSWISTMPEEPRIHNWNVNMA